MRPYLKRIRWAVRGTLALGVAASVAANILHARDNPISEIIAAWPPLALLLTVELISRIPVHRRALGAVRLFATATIAGIAAWVSYWHMVGVTARYGETGATPYLLPLSVDGLVIVASVSLVELAGRIRETEAVTQTFPQGNHSVTPPPETPAPPVSDIVVETVTPPESDTVTGTVTPPTPPAKTPVKPAKKAAPRKRVPAKATADQPQKRRPPAPRKATSATANGSLPVARVKHWHGKMPDAPDDQIAEKAGVDPATVAQYRPALQAAEPVPVGGSKPT